MARVELGDWTAWARSGPVPPGLDVEFPARVPGCVHTDLMAAGLLPDPLLRDEELRQHWIGLTDWSMATRFDLPSPGPATLCLDGVDTLASILVDGRQVARVQDMHRRHRIDLGSLAAGAHQVRVDFESPVRAADRLALEQGMRAHINTHPFNAVRKMACSFGWDWGPDTATSGLWREAWVELGTSPCLDRLRLETSVEDGVGRLRVRLDEPVDELAVHLVGHGVDHRARAAGGTVELRVPSAEPWWPAGAGAQPLYEVEVVAHRAGQRSEVLRRVGFRSAQWHQDRTTRGSDFRLVVNGEPIWVRGVNWIPDDPFPHRVDRGRLRHRLEQATELGCNLVRVWGGGTWESDDFYDVCDELGLMVWQDATFACAFYDESPGMWAEVEAEVVDNLCRIGHHTSLVLVNGGNECEVMGAGRGWQDARDPDLAWGLGYWRDLVPRLASELVPQVQYIPNSPFSPDPGDDPNDQAQGTIHIWDLWNSRPYGDYRSYRPGFAAEFGWQGPPAWSTLRQAVDDEPMTPTSPQVVLHQKADGGQLKIQRGIVRDFGVQPDMRRWHWAAQLVQARALHTAVDWYRSLPECGGTIVWQLNDCWPVISWSVVDSRGWRKPGYYALQRTYAPRVASVHPDSAWNPEPRVNLSNHGPEVWHAEGTVLLVDAAGAVVAEQRVAGDVAPFGVLDVVLDAALAHPAAGQFLRVDVEGAPRQHWWPTVRDGEQSSPTRLDVSLADGDLVVRAGGVVRDLWLAVDEIVDDADASSTWQTRVQGEQLVTLLPGEQHRWHLAGLELGCDLTRLRAAVKCANDLHNRTWRE